MEKEIRDKLKLLVDSAQCADLGFIDGMGIPSIRKVFCTCHKGLRAHLISTNTSSLHIQELEKTTVHACILQTGITSEDYVYSERPLFITTPNIKNFYGMKEMSSIIRRAWRTRITV